MKFVVKPMRSSVEASMECIVPDVGCRGFFNT